MEYIDKVQAKRELDKATDEKEKLHNEIIEALRSQNKVLEEIRDALKASKNNEE